MTGWLGRGDMARWHSPRVLFALVKGLEQFRGAILQALQKHLFAGVGGVISGRFFLMFLLILAEVNRCDSNCFQIIVIITWAEQDSYDYSRSIYKAA